MHTRVTTDITSEPLSASGIADFLKYEDGQQSELDLIDQMIAEVRCYMERRTGLSFAQKTLETFFLRGDYPYMLPVSPVISVDKVETVDYDGSTTELTENSGYYLRGSQEKEVVISPWSDVIVTYKAGYGHDDTEDLPKDIEGAMKQQVWQWYYNRGDWEGRNYLPHVEKVVKLHRKDWI